MQILAMFLKYSATPCRVLVAGMEVWSSREPWQAGAGISAKASTRVRWRSSWERDEQQKIEKRTKQTREPMEQGARDLQFCGDRTICMWWQLCGPSTCYCASTLTPPPLFVELGAGYWDWRETSLGTGLCLYSFWGGRWGILETQAAFPGQTSTKFINILCSPHLPKSQGNPNFSLQ